MIPIFSLWLPIVLSAVLVFVASSLIHMALRYHNSDFKKLPDEKSVTDALRPLNIPPGEYAMPFSADMKEMRSEEFKDKRVKGPNAIMTVFPNGVPSMGKYLAQWFVYNIVVAFIAAYVTSRAVPTGGEYLAAFRFAGVTTFCCYTLASYQASIWFNRSWTTNIKNTIDGLIYALLTGGVFGWLWPR